MRKFLPLFLLLAGCATPPEITAKAEELQSLRNQVKLAQDHVRELPALQQRRQQLVDEKAGLLLRKLKASKK
jgi:hypothetical protein